MKFERMCCILYYWSSWQLSLETERENMLSLKNLHGIFVHGISASILWKQFKYVVFFCPFEVSQQSSQLNMNAVLPTMQQLFFWHQNCFFSTCRSAIQSLDKSFHIAEQLKYLPEGLTHTWVEYYRSKMDFTDHNRLSIWSVLPYGLFFILFCPK